MASWWPRRPARAIARKGGKAEVVPLDITDEAAVRDQIAALESDDPK